jgi:catechol 2,3-dioxygenase-like lactoylglutathione lyase family enzyme
VPDRLGYAILFVDDLEASVRFYRDTLGVPFRFSSETLPWATRPASAHTAWRRVAPGSRISTGDPAKEVCDGAVRGVW